MVGVCQICSIGIDVTLTKHGYTLESVMQGISKHDFAQTWPESSSKPLQYDKKF